MPVPFTGIRNPIKCNTNIAMSWGAQRWRELGLLCEAGSSGQALAVFHHLELLITEFVVLQPSPGSCCDAEGRHLHLLDEQMARDALMLGEVVVGSPEVAHSENEK